MAMQLNSMSVSMSYDTKGTGRDGIVVAGWPWP